jgi:2-keto-4-pentenoate hydratase/2-oxohepta-3-ene-1,7-dioic acid hydratase in catechol pathway
LDRVQFLPPTSPSKVVCVGRNYHEHIQELGNEVPKQPLIFFKPPSSIVSHGGAIVLPPESHRVDYEGELAFIIARPCRRLRPDEDVRPYILGYTALNDVTARDLQKADGQWTRAKGFDTFCPIGPVIETETPPSTGTVETFVNGARKQSGQLEEMIFPIDVVLRWITDVMTLLPGDVVSTGTPSGIGPLAPGDVVEVAVSGVATLRNTVAAQAS